MLFSESLIVCDYKERLVETFNFFYFINQDPYLCNACGFCKYAKFDLTLSAKPCCTVEPVEGEEDRKKALLGINALLEKADRLQGQLSYSRYHKMNGNEIWMYFYISILLNC